VNAVEVLGRPVLDLATATTVGHVDDVDVDPAARRAIGFHLAKSSAGDWLSWDQITAIGPDAVTIQSAEAVATYAADPARRMLRKGGALGGRVLTDQGREVGSLNDVEIDDDGAIVSLLVGDRRVEADDLLGIGSYASVVRDTTDDG
jgi:sporulation protein YlmC with PRC-barrel domain